MLPIIRTVKADDDLMSIWAYIARDDPRAADRVLGAIEARWQLLARHPLSGIARDEIAPGMRSLVAGQYLTLLRVVHGRIEIARVLHDRRRIASDLVE